MASRREGCQFDDHAVNLSTRISHSHDDSPLDPSSPALPTPSTAIRSASPVSIRHLLTWNATVPLLFSTAAPSPPSLPGALPSGGGTRAVDLEPARWTLSKMVTGRSASSVEEADSVVADGGEVGDKRRNSGDSFLEMNCEGGRKGFSSEVNAGGWGLGRERQTCLWRERSRAVGAAPTEYQPRNSSVGKTCLTGASEKGWYELLNHLRRRASLSVAWAASRRPRPPHASLRSGPPSAIKEYR